MWRPCSTGRWTSPRSARPGARWVSPIAGVEPGERALAVALDAPERIVPRSRLDIGVALGNVQPGETAYVTLAAVDVGILNITQFDRPRRRPIIRPAAARGRDPRPVFAPHRPHAGGAGFGALGRRRGCGRLAPAADGRPRGALLGRRHGGRDGRATVSRLDVPDFNGTLKSWRSLGRSRASARRTGTFSCAIPWWRRSAARSSSVPVTARASRSTSTTFEGPGGGSTCRCPGGARPLRVEANAEADLELAENGRARLLVAVEALAPGEAAMELALVTPGGERLTKSFTLPVRSIQPREVKKSRFEIAAAAPWTSGPTSSPTSSREPGGPPCR